MSQVIGPDISFFQDEPSTPQGVDFVKMRAISNFVILRAGQNIWVDSCFKTYWSDAKTVGLPRGSYWFYDSRSDPKKQAELWVQTLGNDMGELPLFADFEESYGGAYKGWQNWYVFLERLKALVGQKDIGIYTAYYYWRDNAPDANTQNANLEYFHKYALWIANYLVDKPMIPKPWDETEWSFWQYTDKGDGKLYGVESVPIDLNYFNGTENAFKTRFNLSDAPPVPGNEVSYRIDLSVRTGPEESFDSLGNLSQDDVVTRLSTSDDKNWIQIRREDGLTGWTSINSFVRIATPIPEPDPKPDPEPEPEPGSGNMFRVIADSLRMRSGPGLAFEIVGSLMKNEIVEEINANNDRSWLRILRQDGLIGWSVAEYLEANETPPAPPPSSDLPWYQVMVSSLLVRDGPGTSYKVIGNLVKDDSVSATSPIGSGWVQITRSDGLTGWCAVSYLKDIGNIRPKTIRQRLFLGATYFRKEYSTPRTLVAHILALDLNATSFFYLVTPESQPGGILCTRTTSQFLSEFGVHIAINGDGFAYLPSSASTCPDSGDMVNPNGYAASRGKIYNEKQSATVFINANNQITIGTAKGPIYNAVSGDRIVLSNGQRVKDLAIDSPAPRTAIGLTKNGRGLVLMVIDGSQAGYSEGVNLHELVDMLTSFGAYDGINMDGGGSSTLVIKGIDGAPRVLNQPIDNNLPGKERAVANHLGIFIKA